MKNRIDICKQTREIAASSLKESLKKLLQKHLPFSEIEIRDKWLLEMRKHPSIFPEGWYVPPPHGIGVLIGTTQKNSRQNYQNLRTEKNWPQENIYVTDSSNMLYVYASPVDKETGIIGDFGMTIYFGNNLDIKEHLKKCLHVTKEIAVYVEVGMAFSEIYTFAQKLFKKHDLINGVMSPSDPTGVNIGHTIPTSYEQDDWSREEKELLNNKTSSWKDISQQISKKRKFINAIEKQKVTPHMAITIEPRPTVIDNPTIPMASYHTILLIHANGKKELLTNFEDIFGLAKMDYMLE